ncbi:MAG TPA: hypothetical protein VJP39_01835 [Gaiellaceae bacterium]|nr:hypothetical protein [Gaiellaceae bacterium]
MPTRKQRKRHAKSMRHEYETVLIDEEGNETVVDADEERAAREERDKERAAAKSKSKPAAKSRSTRPMREPPPPSWNRAFKRGGLMGALIFVLFVFVLKGGSTIDRVAIPLFYAVAFIPLTYVVDRWSYRMYQKRLAKKD